MVICFMPVSRHASMLFWLGWAEAVRAVFLKVSLTSRLMFCFSFSLRVGSPRFMVAMPVSSMSLASLTCST